jgi:hypothetical protein
MILLTRSGAQPVEEPFVLSGQALTYVFYILHYKTITLDHRLDDQGFKSQYGLGIFLLTTVPRLTLGPTQHVIQWVAGSFSLGVRRPGRETAHLCLVPRSNMFGAIPPLPNMPSWHSASLKEKPRDNYLYLRYKTSNLKKFG